MAGGSRPRTARARAATAAFVFCALVFVAANSGPTNRAFGDTATGGGVAESSFSTTWINPSGVVTGPDGALWFAYESDSRVGGVGRLVPGTSPTLYTNPRIINPSNLISGGDGALWFINGDGAIGRISVQGDFTFLSCPSQVGGPYGLTWGPDGNLWSIYGLGDDVVRITPQGACSFFPIPPSAGEGSALSAIVAGPDGALWFVTGASDIGRITTQGAMSFITSPSIASATAITAAGDGALWFTNAQGGAGIASVGRVTTAGVVTTYGPLGVSMGRQITVGPDGALWFVNIPDQPAGTALPPSPEICRITTTGDLTHFAVPDTSVTRLDIGAGPDGALWYTAAGGLGRLTSTGDASVTELGNGIDEPGHLISGPDGAFWYTNIGSGSIGRITADGQSSAFLDSAHDRQVGFMITGPDGNIWYDDITGSLYRLTPTGDLTTFPVPSGYLAAGPDGKVWFNSNGNIERIDSSGAVSTVERPARIPAPSCPDQGKLSGSSARPSAPTPGSTN